MSAPAFTPGPWESVVPYAGSAALFVRTAAKTIVIIGCDEERWLPEIVAEATANARLIAAAPELYEALEGVLGEFVDDQQGTEQFASGIVRKAVERAQAALGKARGEA